MLTLREEILKNSGLLAEEEKDRSKDPRWVKYFRTMFNTLYEREVERSGKSYEEFAGSDEYKKWVDKELKPLFKNEGVKKIFEKWEYDLLMDYSD